MTITEVFKTYFLGKGSFAGLGLPALEMNYAWKIPDCLFLSVNSKDSLLQQNIDLKHVLQIMWRDQPANREEISKWVVAKWGGIGGNSKSTFEKYLDRMKSESPDTPLHGIASFSKILAASDPKKFAIYDARVAVSLNAIQLLSGIRQGGRAFPYLDGRNNIVGHAGKKQGFRYHKGNEIRHLVGILGWQKMKRNEAYQHYLNLLQTTVVQLNSLYPYAIYHLEMALFADAERLVEKVVGIEQIKKWTQG